MKKEKNNISYEEVMNAIAIIQANIIATRTHEMQSYINIIISSITKPSQR